MILPTLKVEKTLWGKGLEFIVGIDEVGRGSWAGPLVAAGVILPKDFRIPSGLKDSKQLTKGKREEFNVLIKRTALCYSIVEVSHTIINKIGVGEANQIAFRQVINRLKQKPDFAIIDGFHIKYVAKSKQLPIKFGDAKCASIAAASIIAKVYRDHLMTSLSAIYPKYSFEQHKGYGTKNHQKAIQKYGFCEIHRTGYNLNFLFT